VNDLMTQWGELFPDLLPGLLVTLQLTVLSLLLGLPLGVLLAVGAMAPSRVIRWPVIALVEVGRGAPALILLYLVYYGLPQMNILLASFPAAVLAIALTTGAYSSEVFRAGLQAVPRGQREASRALGLSAWNEFRLVVLPQAIRIVIPPLIGLSIIVFQGTSLAYAVSVPELLSRAYNAGTISFQFLPPLTLAGLMYAVVSLAGIALLRVRRRRSARRRTPAAPATSIQI
jgi:amine acid ABC transporter, permease protein, 3-TM region, His/Glu/Gln/Arg/opine family